MDPSFKSLLRPRKCQIQTPHIMYTLLTDMPGESIFSHVRREGENAGFSVIRCAHCSMSFRPEQGEELVWRESQIMIFLSVNTICIRAPQWPSL